MTKRSVQVKRSRAPGGRAAPGQVASPGLASGWAAPRRWLSREMAAIALLGVAASGYLAYSKLLNNQLYCAGLGDCESVNASAYAYLFGVPVSLFGLASYLCIMALSLSRLFLDDDWSFLASLGVFILAISGTIFSLFLTYLEFFVLNASCPWCLTSAALTTILLAMAVVVVRRQLKTSRGQLGRKAVRSV